MRSIEENQNEREKIILLNEKKNTTMESKEAKKMFSNETKQSESKIGKNLVLFYFSACS